MLVAWVHEARAATPPDGDERNALDPEYAARGLYIVPDELVARIVLHGAAPETCPAR